MIWTRQGESDVFLVTGTVNGEAFSAEQRITIKGQNVHIDRYKASDGNICTFKGTTDSEQWAEGTYTCTKYQPSGGWRVTIYCKQD